jgi:DNA-binding Lrp family transcriptional regulator
LEIARDEFGELHDETGLSPDALGKMLSELDVLEAWAKRVRAYALEQAMEGHAPAGHKLVMKRAVRKWRDDSAAATALREVFDMADDEVFVKKMRSPAQVEKLLDKTSRKAMADLVTKTSSGVTLAPESDKREAISPDAAAEFSTVEIEE